MQIDSFNGQNTTEECFMDINTLYCRGILKHAFQAAVSIRNEGKEGFRILVSGFSDTESGLKITNKPPMLDSRVLE